MKEFLVRSHPRAEVVLLAAAIREMARVNQQKEKTGIICMGRASMYKNSNKRVSLKLKLSWKVDVEG